MSEHRASVKGVIAHLGKAKTAYKERDQHDRAVEMARWEADLRAFLRDYEKLEALTRPIPVVDGQDLSDLPAELLSELTLTKSDELEDQITTIVNAAGGEADIDTILIYLFRRFEVVQTRRFIQNKLWRMPQKGLLHSVPRRKGVYSVTKPEDEEDLLEQLEDAAEALSVNVSDDDDEIPF